MRDIIFRGKRMDNGEWVYGNLFVPDLENSPTEILVGTNVVRISYEVDPDTVCQYIGMLDRNGKRIFENDIVSAGCYMLVTWDEKFGSWCLQRKGWAFKHFFGEAVYPQDCEIVSNVFDNRDLLEAKV